MSEHSVTTKEGLTISSSPEGLDEVVTSKPVHVHIERMDKDTVWMRIGETDFWFFAVKGTLYNNAHVGGGFGVFADSRGRGKYERRYDIEERK